MEYIALCDIIKRGCTPKYLFDFGESLFFIG